jgi:hypothetical protein
MFYTFIVFSFGVYIGQEYLLLPSVRVMIERTIAYIHEQHIQLQARAHLQQDNAQNNNYFNWYIFRNMW